MESCELVEKFAREPEGLMEFCRAVAARIESVGKDKTLAKQFKAVASSVQMLEKQGVPVPDALRQEKLRLGAAIEDGERADWRKKLCRMAEGLEEVAKTLLHKYGEKAPRKQEGTKNPKGKKSNRGPNLLHTPKEKLRELIVEVLKKHDGAAKPKDVVAEIADIVGGKWFPGDLVLRKDGRTLAWVNNVHWEAARMKQEGLLVSDNGNWTLTEA